MAKVSAKSHKFNCGKQKYLKKEKKMHYLKSYPLTFILDHFSLFLTFGLGMYVNYAVFNFPIVLDVFTERRYGLYM